MQHGRVAAEVGVVVFQHLGVIGGQAHEDQQADGAEHKIHDAEAKAEQAEQPAHQAADDQGNQTAHELGAPAGQVTVGDVAVHRHNAEVDRTDEERQNQAAEVIHEEDGAQIQAVEHRVGEEDARGRGRLQPSTATGIFFAYAVLNGLNLSSIFLVYDFGSLILAFLVGAVYFGVMAVYGNVTNRDLTGWGPKLMGGLVALIVCGLVGGLFSLFGFGFGIMDLVLCAVGLLIFMGLTAYDTQMLKYYYSYFGGDAAMLHKSSIIGALNLYLDFINIFLYILRMLGRRSND